MKIIRADKRHFSDQGWLKTFWLFSFADYYDPDNVRHGALRVFNDDIVEAGEGFGTHPHKEMEIVTIILSGEITHTDSMGNDHLLKAGEVQRMSAGTGITHSEFNRSTKALHLFQIWIEPGTSGLTPSYEQRAFDPADSVNNLLPVVSGQELEGALNIHSDSSIFISTLNSDSGLNYKSEAGRAIFIYVVGGEVEVNGQRLLTCDQARLEGAANISITAREDSSLVLIDSIV
ncbi:MAG: pirin family protein [Proteobacteria bacterium]|nr:pirin family protein [Pseudomonadota bacterium]